MTLFRRSALLIFLAGIFVISFITAAAAQNKSQGQPPQFAAFTVQVAKTEEFTIFVDPKTASRYVDKDGHTISGSIYLIRPTVPRQSPQGPIIAAVNVMIGICGQDTVILASSKLYGVDNKLMADIVQMESIASNQPLTPVDFIYRHLCPTSWIPSRSQRIA